MLLTGITGETDLFVTKSSAEELLKKVSAVLLFPNTKWSGAEPKDVVFSNR